MPQLSDTQNNVKPTGKWIIVAQGGEGHSAEGETHAGVGTAHAGEHEGAHNPLAEHPAWYYSGIGLMVCLIVLGISAYSLRRGLSARKPSRGQSLLEQAVESITWFSRNAIGPGGEKFAPFIGTVFAYVLVANLMGVMPFYWKREGSTVASFTPAPTANLSMTLALGLIVFFVFNFVGIQRNGIVNYVKHLWGPIWWLGPLMLIIETVGLLVRPISLAFRLFGNVFGEETVIAVLIAMAAGLYFIPVQLPMLAFGVFGSVIQAGVFTILTCAYIALAIGDHDHGEHGDDHAHAGHAGQGAAVAAH